MPRKTRYRAYDQRYTLQTCSECGAVIDPMRTANHDGFHAFLDEIGHAVLAKAVDTVKEKLNAQEEIPY